MNATAPNHRLRLPLFLLGLISLLSNHSPLSAQIVSERSVQLGNTPINVTFTNQMGTTVNAYWVDTQGLNQSIGLLLPNQSIQITTFPGHVTIFTSGNRTVAKYKGSALGNKAFSIVGPTGRPANSTPVASIQLPGPSTNATNTGGNRRNNTLSNIGTFLQTLSNSVGRNRSGSGNLASAGSLPNNGGVATNSNSTNLASLLSTIAGGGGQTANRTPSNTNTRVNSNPSTNIPAQVSTTTANFRQDPTLNLPIDPAKPDTVSIQIAIMHVTNEHRARNGRPEVTLSTQHSAAAQQHSEYQRSIGRITHQNNSDPTRREFGQRSALQGANDAISENVLYNYGVNYVAGSLIYGNQKLPRHTAITMADAMVTQWKNSPGHNTNMLAPNAKGIGVGVAIDLNAANLQLPKAYATQVFSG